MMDIEQKCKVVADGFHWWSKTANRYLEEGQWTDGRVQFVEQRYSIHERIDRAFERQDWKLSVPGNVSLCKWSVEFDVKLAVVVSGFRSKEYVHVLNPTGTTNLILYRTKDKARALEQGASVSGKVWAKDKVLFAGRQFPVASKVKLA